MRISPIATAVLATFFSMMHATAALAEPEQLTATERLAALKLKESTTRELLADDIAMEFATVAEFSARLPGLKGVAVDTSRTTPPGVTVYTDSLDPIWNTTDGAPTVRIGDRTSWILLAPPLKAAPALMRMRDHAQTGENGKTHVTTRMRLLCEGPQAACEEQQDILDSMIPERRLLKEEQAY